MAFPTTKDNLINGDLSDASHINTLQDKVGIDGDTNSDSHDYKLSEITATDKAVGKTATQTLTNKTLTSPKINVGSDAAGDLYYRNASGNFVRLAKGTDGQYLSLSSGIPSWKSIQDDGSMASASGTDVASSESIKAYVDNQVSSDNKASATISSNQSIPNSTVTKLTLATEIYDPGDNFDNSTSYSFTAPAAGTYIVTASARVDDLGDNLGTLSVYKNGSVVVLQGRGEGESTIDVAISVTGLVNLSQNDTLDLRFFQNSGSAKNIIAADEYTFLSIHFMSGN